MNWEKYVFHWENWNFEPILNPAHTTELLASLVKTQIKNKAICCITQVDNMWNETKVTFNKFTFGNGFMKNRELNSCKL